MSKYWFYDMRTSRIITVVAHSVEEATMRAKKAVGHNYVFLCSAASV